MRRKNLKDNEKKSFKMKIPYLAELKELFHELYSILLR